MRGPLWEGLLKNHEPRLKPPYSTLCFGELIGTLDSGEDCWEVSGDLRDLYYTAIHPKLCERLFAIFGTASISDWITLPVYMVGQHRTNALPTVMVCSEDENVRKKARREIKKSAFLKEHAKFKVMSVPADPGMRNMEQLASDATEGKRPYAAKRATKVLIDSTKPVQPFGMEIWVDHGSSLRPTTAFVAHIHGRTFLRTVDHAFVSATSSVKANTTTRNATIHIDSDSESESESDDEDDHDVAITSIGSQSPDSWSDTGSDSGISSASTASSGKSTPTIDDVEDVNSNAVPLDFQEISSRLAPLASVPTTYPPKHIVQPPENTLVSLGRLALWSVDKDWALIEITNEELSLALEQSTTEAAPPIKSLPGPKDNAEVVSYTSSGGMLTGTFSGIPFCMRLPNSSSFQDVHRVRLDGSLANGDCGSAVRNAATGELYGHIVAGCRTTGTAFVMASHQVEADFADLKMGGPFRPRQTPDEVQNLATHTADTERKSEQDSVDLIPLSATESVVNSVRYDVEPVTSSPLLTQRVRVTIPPQREALENPDCHDQQYHFFVEALCWALELLSVPLPLFILGFEVFILHVPLLVLLKMFLYDAKTVSLNTALTPYLLLLVWYSSGHLSLRLVAKLDASFALMKIIVLTATCYMGCLAYTDLIPEADSSIWSLPATAMVAISFPSLARRTLPLVHILGDPVDTIYCYLDSLKSWNRIYRLTRQHTSVATTALSALDRNNGSLPTGSLRTHQTLIVVSGLVGIMLYWISGYATQITYQIWEYMSCLGPYLFVIMGAFLPVLALYYVSKRRRRCRSKGTKIPKRVAMGPARHSGFKLNMGIQSATVLSIPCIYWMDAVWSTLCSLASMTAQFWQALYFPSSIVWVHKVVSIFKLVFAGTIVCLIVLTTYQDTKCSDFQSPPGFCALSFVALLITHCMFVSLEEMTALFPTSGYPPISATTILLVCSLTAFFQGFEQGMEPSPEDISRTPSTGSSPLLIIGLVMWFRLQSPRTAQEDRWTDDDMYHILPSRSMDQIFQEIYSHSHGITREDLAMGAYLARRPLYATCIREAYAPWIPIDELRVLDREARRPTPWNYGYFDDHNCVSDVNFRLKVYFGCIATALFSLIGPDKVHMLIFELSSRTDPPPSYTANLAVRGTVGFLFAFSITTAATTFILPITRIAYAWSHHRELNTAILGSICRICSWLTLPVAMSFLFKHAEHESSTNPLIVFMSLIWAILSFNISHDRTSRLLGRSHGHLRSALVFFFLFPSILVPLGWDGSKASNLRVLLDQIVTQDHPGWLRCWLGLFAPSLLGVCLVNLLSESPNSLRRRHNYEQKLLSTSLARFNKLRAANDLILVHFRMKAEEAFREALYERKPRLRLNRLRAWMFVEAPYWCVLIALVLHFYTTLSPTVKTPFELTNSMASTSNERPLWVEMIRSYYAPLICLSLYLMWKVCNHYISVNRLDDILPQLSTQPKSFIPVMIHAKSVIGFTTCIATVIVMGINAFLIKEVENWKRVSFGFALGDVVAMTGIAYRIYQLCKEDRSADIAYKNFSQDIATLQKKTKELQQLLIDALEKKQANRHLGCELYNKNGREGDLEKSTVVSVAQKENFIQSRRHILSHDRGSRQPTDTIIVCTYCSNLGISSSFKRKHDWKRHEKTIHETEYEKALSNKNSSGTSSRRLEHDNKKTLDAECGHPAVKLSRTMVCGSAAQNKVPRSIAEGNGLARSSADIGIDEEGATRSMARRRKSEKPGTTEYSCRDCKKEFKRPCDLTKHEKTHSRPWKCSEEKCRYFDLGWPTEKERDRHVNDKHSVATVQHKSLYPSRMPPILVLYCESSRNECDPPIWDVARATSAAPTFFPLFSDSRTKEGVMDGAISRESRYLMEDSEGKPLWSIGGNRDPTSTMVGGHKFTGPTPSILKKCGFDDTNTTELDDPGDSNAILPSLSSSRSLQERKMHPISHRLLLMTDDERPRVRSQLDRWSSFQNRLAHHLDHLDLGGFYGEHLIRIRQHGRALLAKHALLVQLTQFEELQMILDPGPSLQRRNVHLEKTRHEEMTALVDALEDLCELLMRTKFMEYRMDILFSVQRDIDIVFHRLEAATTRMVARYPIFLLSVKTSLDSVPRNVGDLFNTAINEMRVGHPSTRPEPNDEAVATIDPTFSTSLWQSSSQQPTVGNSTLACHSCHHDSQLKFLLEISKYLTRMNKSFKFDRGREAYVSTLKNSVFAMDVGNMDGIWTWAYGWNMDFDSKSISHLGDCMDIMNRVFREIFLRGKQKFGNGAGDALLKGGALRCAK